MDCYDTIMIFCPRCGTTHGAQSEGGRGALAIYALRDAPEDVMADVNRHAPFVCRACATVFEVDVQNRKTVQLQKTAEEVRQDILWGHQNYGNPSKDRSEVEANELKDCRKCPFVRLLHLDKAPWRVLVCMPRMLCSPRAVSAVYTYPEKHLGYDCQEITPPEWCPLVKGVVKL